MDWAKKKKKKKQAGKVVKCVKEKKGSQIKIGWKGSVWASEDRKSEADCRRRSKLFERIVLQTCTWLSPATRWSDSGFHFI